MACRAFWFAPLELHPYFFNPNHSDWIYAGIDFAAEGLGATDRCRKLSFPCVCAGRNSRMPPCLWFRMSPLYVASPPASLTKCILATRTRILFVALAPRLSVSVCNLVSRVLSSVLQTDEETGEVVVASEDWDGYRVRIVSRNTFPTAAGLASSAAGLACLSEYLHVYSSASVLNRFISANTFRRQRAWGLEYG